jgi:hypothetical protein
MSSIIPDFLILPNGIMTRPKGAPSYVAGVIMNGNTIPGAEKRMPE